jgi:luciferase-like monooxygenase
MVSRKRRFLSMIMAVRDAKKRICEVVGSWNGVTLAPHRFGGTQFRLGHREIGHIHGDRLVDIPFPKARRDELVRNGDAEPHHILPHSGWVSLFLRAESDVERAIQLLRASFELAGSRHTPENGFRSTPPG